MLFGATLGKRLRNVVIIRGVALQSRFFRSVVLRNDFLRSVLLPGPAGFARMIAARGGPRTIRPDIPSSTDASEAQVFDFKVFVDAVFRTFAAQPRLLDSAERRDLC